MRLLKVRVPDFRGLKNVEINFEQDLTPQVFPLGGENGSGKSTLLQLVFTLLHCADNKETEKFLWNMIKHMKRPDEKWELKKYDIATIEIENLSKKWTLNFFIDSDPIPIGKSKDENNEDIIIFPYSGTETGMTLDSGTGIEMKFVDNGPVFFLYITIYSDLLSDMFLFRQISFYVFLAGQATQPYLFLADENIRELFKVEGNYEKTLEETRKALPNFYTYNNSAIMEILELFKAASDEDRKQAATSSRPYGTAFISLRDKFKQILGNGKYIFPTPELDGITVRYQTGKDEFIDLGPGDLSHGELKRLSLYSWIRNKKINNSIVLIDEIENGLHPDWQYNIVRDLAEWGDNNQYILATHSFYLCEALTPRHVKILEPAMKNPVGGKV